MIALLFTLIAGLIFLGFLLWLFKFLPIDATIASLVKGIVIFLVVATLLYQFYGYFFGGGLPTHWGSRPR